jgi:uroporphyrin-III C-methyltransferase/precorrin-2 dehydrogenase/sirohydrochlorin ferrochelatase
VTVAFSTSGQAPALAGLLREAFEVLLPEDIGAWAQRAHELSRAQRRDGVPMAARRPELLRALNELYDSREARS